MKQFYFAAFSLLFLLVLVIGPLTCHAQAPAWKMAIAMRTDGANTYSISAMAPDASGNLYVVGTFQGTVSFGSTTLTSAGQQNLFMAKWNSTNNSFGWVRQAGGDGTSGVRAVVVEGTNMYVAGAFSGTASFGPTTLVSSGGLDAFVAKLTDVGTSTSKFAWARSVSGVADEYAAVLAVSGTSVYLSGVLMGTAAFDALRLTAADRYGDVYVAKLTDTGTDARFTWVQQAGGDGQDVPDGMAVVGPNVYVGGTFSSDTASFGPSRLRKVRYSDLFIAKLIDQGTSASFIWAQGVGGDNFERITGLAASGSSVYIAGDFLSTTLTFGSTTLTKRGSYDLFVAKLTDAGSTSSFTWAQQAGGLNTEFAGGLALNNTSLYLTGVFSGGAAAFGGTVLGSPDKIDNNDLFVAKLADEGESARFIWAQQAGGAGNDFGSKVAVAGTDVYVTGGANLPATFGGIMLPRTQSESVNIFAAVSDVTPTATLGARARFDLSLAPNPAHAVTTVWIPAVPGAHAAALTLLDALGRTVRTLEVVLPAIGQRHELNLTGLPVGFYALRVTAGKSSTVQRLVVE